MDISKQVPLDVQRALDEDVGSGDLTAALVPAQARATASSFPPTPILVELQVTWTATLSGSRSKRSLWSR